MRVFALHGAWSTLGPAQFDYDSSTGEVTLPANPLGFAYNEVEITYNAGLAAIADPLKFACAQIVRNAQATPALTVRAGAVESMQLQYFSGDLLYAGVRAHLTPYVALKAG